MTYQNIVGQRYLGLSLGPEGNQSVLPPGSALPLERTEPSFDVTALLNGYEPLFSLLNPQDADNLTKGIIASLQGDTSSLTTLISQTSTLTETFAGRDQALGAVITNLVLFTIRTGVVPGGPSTRGAIIYLVIAIGVSAGSVVLLRRRQAQLT